eukprot:5242229-Pyramimonas_sp.AAC.1
MTSFGPLVQELQVPIAGQKHQPLWVQNPFAFLEVAAAESRAFSEFLRGVLGRSRNRLDVIVYADDATAGNPLGEHLTR